MRSGFFKSNVEMIDIRLQNQLSPAFIKYVEERVKERRVDELSECKISRIQLEQYLADFRNFQPDLNQIMNAILGVLVENKHIKNRKNAFEDRSIAIMKIITPQHADRLLTINRVDSVALKMIQGNILHVSPKDTHPYIKELFTEISSHKHDFRI